MSSWRRDAASGQLEAGSSVCFSRTFTAADVEVGPWLPYEPQVDDLMAHVHMTRSKLSM